MKIVLAGATGFIGNQIRADLREVGCSVISISRRSGNSMSWSDLQNKGLPEGTAAVISVCGQNILDPSRRWTSAFKQSVYSSRVSTTKLLADSIKRAAKKPESFVTISGVGYYPPSETEVYDELSGGGNHDFLSRMVTDWEAAARSVDDDENVRTVQIRSGVVLGRRGGMIRSIIFPFCLGFGGRMGPGTQSMPWIHVKDLSRLFLHCVEDTRRSSLRGPVNGVSPEIITNNEFVKTLARQMRRPAVVPLSEPLLNLMFSPERASLVTKGLKVVPKKALDSGFEFFYPNIKEACKEFGSIFYV